MILTYRYRVKDKTTAKHLIAMAGAVNFVWNYCCETEREAHRRRAKSLSHFDLVKLTAGAGAELGILSDTLNAIAHRFATATKAVGRCPGWRSRGSGSLGWVPFSNSRAFRIVGDSVVVKGRRYRLWLSRLIPVDAKIKTANFSEDSRGRWYFNVQADVIEASAKAGTAIGIDLGLNDLATLSNGRKIQAPAFYRKHEGKLALAQQRGQKRRARAIHAKIKNSRNHFLHQESTRIVREHARVIVGDVNSSRLAGTRMAKSVFDAGWATFRTMLQYKCHRAGAAFEIVSERLTTQTCSDCGAVGGPQGIPGLRMRRWTCVCGASHDRDVNAARNILAGAECRPPVAGIQS